MDDLISRAAAIEAATDWKIKPDGEIFAAIKIAIRSKIEQLPAVDAVPVEWLEAQIKPYTGDVSDIGKSARNGTIRDLIRKWKKVMDGLAGRLRT